MTRLGRIGWTQTLVAVIGVAGIAGLGSPARAQSQEIATLEAVRGGATVIRLGLSQAPTSSMPLQMNDIVVTKQGRATVRFHSDGSMLRIGPDSRVQINESATERDVTVFVGRLWAHVVRAQERLSRFRSGSTIAAIRGTEVSLGVAADAPVVLTAARLMERKGVDTVIRALPEVLRASPTAVYLVAGTGADEARLRRLTEELGLKSRVRFLGDASHEALVNYYHACDVFVMPNRGVEETGETETFGVVFLEANACGKPVIGGRVGGVLDAIEDGESGLLVDPTDVQAVATAIVRFLNDPEYARQVGERGRRRARERFSWDRNAAEVLQTLTAAACASRVS